jgi:phosphodiesterase/alkaline phosphatase D-like protein
MLGPTRLAEPRPILGLSRRTCRVLHAISLLGALVVVAGLLLSSRLDLLDARPGGNAFEIKVKPIFMATFVVGALLALRWELLGAIVAAFSASGLSAFALGQLEPASAWLVLAGFALPGAAWLLLDLHDRRPLAAIAGALVVALVATIGGVVSASIYTDLYGPSHPTSSTPTLPDSALDWVWSGGVTTDHAVVVAKLDDGEAAELLVGERPDLSDASPGPRVVADEHDIVRLEVSGLRPGTQYHYAVRVDGVVDEVRTGRFSTPASGVQSFSVAVGSCARVGSNGAVFDTIRELDPAMLVIDGDWNYANLTGEDEQPFREIYDHTLSRASQSALYRSTPIAYVWDDHDYGGNNGDRTSSTRAAAMAVYREYVPHYPLEGPSTPIYQAFTIGRVRFLVTDTRSDRTPALAPDDASKSMLGTEQRAWLERELLAARDAQALTVWINPTPWIGAPSAGSDTWAGYTTERRAIADFIATNDIDRLVMLSGDAHMVAIDDGSNSDYSSTGGAGFPVLHGGALDRPGKFKGGPYSEGAVAGGGQFGLLEVEDLGDSIRVDLTGRDWRNDTLLSYSFRRAVPDAVPTRAV